MTTNKKPLYLTKTDFVHYLQCPRSLWLLKHKPEVYPYKEFSDFLKKIAQEGYEVEEYAQQLFSGGVSLPSGGDAAIVRTKEEIERGTEVLFQATVLTEKGLFARADVLERNENGTYSLYEVKSASGIKEDKKHNHLKDACFQKITFEQAGIAIEKAYIIHTNKEYVRDIELDVHQLLKKVEVTKAIQEVYDETEVEITNALALLQEKEIQEGGCPCFRKTRSNHCDAFGYFNGKLPKHSVWEIGNIRDKKLCTLLDCNVQKIEDIKGEVELNEKQARQAQSVLQGEPIVNEAKIKEMLSELIFPLYFFDYEAASSAVPKIVGTKPWQQIPFQYSLHIMDSEGSLKHEEHINETLSAPEEVIEALCETAGEKGSFISWHASYEKTMNKEMAKMYPKHKEKLENINERTFDLEDIFKEAYTDGRFCGSTSIKKVLPVLCPQLSYKDLAVQDGTQAMEQWFTMVDTGTDKQTKKKIKQSLLAYCELDTLAMVEIYKTLKNLVK